MASQGILQLIITCFAFYGHKLPTLIILFSISFTYIASTRTNIFGHYCVVNVANYHILVRNDFGQSTLHFVEMIVYRIVSKVNSLKQPIATFIVRAIDVPTHYYVTVHLIMQTVTAKIRFFRQMNVIFICGIVGVITYIKGSCITRIGIVQILPRIVITEIISRTTLFSNPYLTITFIAICQSHLHSTSACTIGSRIGQIGNVSTRLMSCHCTT